MGKAQSKRSVDITTEPSKEIQEGSGELKKLDDAYFKENESSDKENKVANDAVENEKNESVKTEDAIAVAADIADESKVEEPSTEDKPEEIKEATPEPDSASKPKKDKVKKKWSFRSISFGKKDKQKPSKKDKKNEDNKAVAEGVEVAEEGAESSKPVEETKTEVVESKPVVEPVVETGVAEVKVEKNVILEAAPVSEPVPAVVDAIKEKTTEPETVATPQETKIEETIEAVEEMIAVVEKVIGLPATIEEHPEEVSEIVSEPIVEEPPAVPTTSPPSQFSVFAETMNTQITEEVLPAPVEIVEVESVNGQPEEDIKPIAEIMVEEVLEEAVEKVESEIAERIEEELPPPPAEEPVETQPASEVVVEVTQNGVGEHIDEQVETVKLENGVHNGDVINESEPKVEELKKEDKVSDKIAQDSQLAPEIISE